MFIDEDLYMSKYDIFLNHIKTSFSTIPASSGLFIEDQFLPWLIQQINEKEYSEINRVFEVIEELVLIYSEESNPIIRKIPVEALIKRFWLYDDIDFAKYMLPRTIDLYRNWTPFITKEECEDSNCYEFTICKKDVSHLSESELFDTVAGWQEDSIYIDEMDYIEFIYEKNCKIHDVLGTAGKHEMFYPDPFIYRMHYYSKPATEELLKVVKECKYPYLSPFKLWLEHDLQYNGFYIFGT